MAGPLKKIPFLLRLPFVGPQFRSDFSIRGQQHELTIIVTHCFLITILRGIQWVGFFAQHNSDPIFFVCLISMKLLSYTNFLFLLLDFFFLSILNLDYPKRQNACYVEHLQRHPVDILLNTRNKRKIVNSDTCIQRYICLFRTSLSA